MYPRILSCFFLLFATISGAHAQENVLPPDSAATLYTIDEVVVTATRNQTLTSSIALPATIIDRDEITLRPGSLLTSSLVTVPGLGVRSYGGGAAVQTVSLRGLGPENVLVLIDGMRANSYQNGGVDFGLIPSAYAEKIEVVRGGHSGLYGADAVGGVINIFSRPPTSAWGGGVRVSAGSFGFSAFEGGFNGSSGTVAWRALARRERGTGGYTFTFDDGVRTQVLTRHGEDFQSDLLDGRVDLDAADNIKIRAGATWREADRGSPGPVTDPLSAGRARLYDKNVLAQTGVDWTASKAIRVNLQGAFQRADQRYSDPGTLLGGSPLNSTSTQQSVLISPLVRWTPSENSSWNIGGELNTAWLTGSETYDSRRWQTALSVDGQYAINLPWKCPAEVIIYPSLRYDTISDVGDDLSAKVGLNIGILAAPLVRVRASYGKNFRAPTFNELYWIAGGNPGLRPERAYTADVGIVIGWNVFGPITLNAGAFSIDSRDRIVWLPATGTYWSPRNIAEVRSRGIEIEGSWRLFDERLRLTANTAWLESTTESDNFPGDPTEGKQLVYVPGQTFSAELTLLLGPADLGVQQFWSSYRYTTPANDEYLPSYATTSAVVRTHLSAAGITGTLKLEVTNLFNTSYQVIALYPMPGREFRATIGVEL